MKSDYIDFQDRSKPLGYLITIRCYGTWLHGDERGSMDRRDFNRYGSPAISPSKNLQKSDQTLLLSPPFTLSTRARELAEKSIREVCSVRGCLLSAINVRTNHVHVVILTSLRPEPLMNSFKSYATRSLRREGIVNANEKVWSRHGSTRYLWTEKHLETAIDYVILGQGGELPKFD